MIQLFIICVMIGGVIELSNISFLKKLMRKYLKYMIMVALVVGTILLIPARVGLVIVALFIVFTYIKKEHHMFNSQDTVKEQHGA